MGVADQPGATADLLDGTGARAGGPRCLAALWRRTALPVVSLGAVAAGEPGSGPESDGDSPVDTRASSRTERTTVLAGLRPVVVAARGVQHPAVRHAPGDLGDAGLRLCDLGGTRQPPTPLAVAAGGDAGSPGRAGAGDRRDGAGSGPAASLALERGGLRSGGGMAAAAQPLAVPPVA